MTQQKQANKRLTTKLLVIAVLMFGFGFALVPLYNVMCKTLGINGKTSGTAVAENKQIDKTRTVTVEFLATNNENLPWEFHPNVKRVQLHPGEMKKISYFAKNDTNRPMVVQAIPSVTPGLAAQYIKKTECFCFTQQTLKGHASRDMPLLFHLDPHLPKNIHTITLSYTLFDVTNRHLKVRPEKAGKIS